MHVLPVWCMRSTFLYGDFVGPLKMCHSNDYLEKFIEHMEDEVKQLYATFLQQPMTELTDVLKSEHEAIEKCYTCFKEFNYEHRKIEITAITWVYIEKQPTTTAM